MATLLIRQQGRDICDADGRCSHQPFIEQRDLFPVRRAVMARRLCTASQICPNKVDWSLNVVALARERAAARPQIDEAAPAGRRRTGRRSADSGRRVAGHAEAAARASYGSAHTTNALRREAPYNTNRPSRSGPPCIACRQRCTSPGCEKRPLADFADRPQSRHTMIRNRSLR
jgi:hypothetical protein